MTNPEKHLNQPESRLGEQQQLVVEATVDYVRESLGNGTGHGWWHVKRVWEMAQRIAETEDVNHFHVELGALLHDIADHKFHDGDDTIGPQVTQAWLEEQGVSPEEVLAVVEIVEDVTFKGHEENVKPRSIEGQVVQDADRLDALGAIGIARCFAYGGSDDREIYNPNIDPVKYETFEEYAGNKAPSVNHFYEKLLLLKDMMNTKMGRHIAEERHAFMETYLAQFFAEWEGEWWSLDDWSK